jgi:hypothetical protein
MNQNFIETIGYHTRSEVTSGIMTSITIASMVNTGVLTLLTNADLSYVFPHSPLRLQYSDLDVNWYLMIGTALAKTMMVCAVMPWPLLIADVCKMKMKQWLDQRAGASAIAAEKAEEDNDDDYKQASV